MMTSKKVERAWRMIANAEMLESQEDPSRLHLQANRLEMANNLRWKAKELFEREGQAGSAELAVAPPAFSPIYGDGWKIAAFGEYNRLGVVSTKEDRQPWEDRLEAAGFLWNPGLQAWTKELSHLNLAAACRAMEYTCSC